MEDNTEFVVEEGTAFYGRTFSEYRRMFDLGIPDLVERRVLDCPGGPGSFTPVANAVGADATAVDPVYGPPVEDLADLCEETIEGMAAQIREKTDYFDWTFYGDVETRVRYAHAAATRFLADYAHDPERYVEAALPDLPLADDDVDLACSANLLFLYDDRFDEAFHVDAARELCRVAREEVRLSGLQNLAAEPSAHAEPVVAALEADGLAVERRTVPYRFQPGPTEQLVVAGVGGYAP